LPNLIVSRKEGETIVIDERITITVLGSQGKAIRLSISAPKEVNIRRGELPARDAADQDSSTGNSRDS